MTATVSGVAHYGDVEEASRLADRVAVAVIGVPGVARLALGPAATYLPHRMVAGVTLHEGRVSVEVVARYGQPLVDVADRVRAAVRRVVPGLQVDVLIADVE